MIPGLVLLLRCILVGYLALALGQLFPEGPCDGVTKACSTSAKYFMMHAFQISALPCAAESTGIAIYTTVWIVRCSCCEVIVLFIPVSQPINYFFIYFQTSTSVYLNIG